MAKKRYCVVKGCNRKLRTKNKFCHIHTGFSRLPKEKEEQEVKEDDRMIELFFISLSSMIIVSIPMYFLYLLLKKFMESPGNLVWGIGLVLVISLSIFMCIKIDKMKKKKDILHVFTQT